VTAKSDSKDVVDGLDAGADEYLTKPIDQTALVARVKAPLRRKALHAAKPAVPRRPDATDLFLSYSRQDLAKVEALAAVLQQAGWSVWWDRHIKTGTSFDKVIEQALTCSRAVIVAWSKNSADSDWVRAEASYALESNKLLPVRGSTMRRRRCVSSTCRPSISRAGTASATTRRFAPWWPISRI
jgi:hypothetical protein